MWFLFFERFPLPLGAWDGLRYFIVALPEPSIYLFFDFDARCASIETRHKVISIYANKY